MIARVHVSCQILQNASHDSIEETVLVSLNQKAETEEGTC